ncbi:YggS family pyridoxal phosphate-dependent enzyme [Culturomica massiliensis]|uniref:YggS family pyridoxal phosphate-dependent enzyme n=1 Tax=Culturomica massiliensis TaxID=1841857 RepID=UPI000839630F|nr:YggS family pyridoxal phosphate-dependent enzyme [Culturomica massiliensis]
MDIQNSIKEILSELPAGVKLVAVSKTKPVEDIRQAYEVGQRVFGENRPQEMAVKSRELPQDIEWHMIGQLQEKNVKYIAPFVRLIHSVDSLKLLQKIDREAEKNGRIIDCLLEFHIAEEMTKSGLSFEEARHILDSEEYAGLNHVRIVGVMGIATYTDNREQIRAEFHHLKQIFEKLEVLFFTDKSYFKEISMGMSEDYNIAVEEGATMVRIGSSIFGSRIYK